MELVYEPPDANEAGSRFFLRYSGTAPDNATLVTLAGDIGTAWAANLAGLTPTNWSLNKVSIQDITTAFGNFGEDDTVHAGTRSGTEIPQQVAAGVEFKIGVKYRGGKPRWYMPPGNTGDVVNEVFWSDAFVAALGTDVPAFFAAVEALSVGALGTLTHTMLSYYHLFDNVVDSSGRARAVPRYRSPNALHHDVTGYAPKRELSSQRRRRLSTTP